MSGAKEGGSMTYAEALARLREIQAKRGDPNVVLAVQVWSPLRVITPVEWSVWSSLDSRHYYGATAEAVLDRYAAGPTAPERGIDEIGAPDEVAL